MNIINQKKNYIPALFMIWKILKYSGEKRLLLFFSFYMVKISHLNEVSFQDWVKAYILLSKALFINDLIDDSINILINLLDIFACIPLEDFKFLSEIYRQNNISLTNMFVNFDSSLKFFSKFHVYEKSRGVFLILEKMRRRADPKERERVFFNDYYKSNLNKSEKTPETNTSDCNSNDFNLEFLPKRNRSSNNSIIINREIVNKRDRSHEQKNRNSLKSRKISKQIDQEENNNINANSNLNANNNNNNNNANNNKDVIKFNFSPEAIRKLGKNEKENFKENFREKDKESLRDNETTNLRNNLHQDLKFMERSYIPLNIEKEKDNQKIEEENKMDLLNINRKKNIKTSDLNIDDFGKLEKFIDENVKNIEIPTDSPCNLVIYFINLFIN